jgi:multisubunit Na+/H+ antiporter MnhE subunit
LLCSLLHSPVTSSLLGPNILLSTVFSKTLSLHSSRNVSDQILHPHKTSGKIIFLYILIFTFWIANWKTKYSALNDSKHSLTLVCSLFLRDWNFYTSF